MAWTPAQQAAIDQRQANILVSAAAGSGKTAVLTERVMKRIIGNEQEPPIEIDSFLIVTFTSAAAGEMKERILHKLSDYMNGLQENLTEENLKRIDYIERQMALVPQASISTIHSFCLKTIKSYFNRLNIDPNIKVGTKAELDVMKSELLEELLEECLEEGKIDFMALAEVYGDVQGLEHLKELILEVSTFAKSTPFPKVWLNEQVKRLQTHYTNLNEMPWSESIRTHLLSQLQDVKVIYSKARALCEKTNGPELYLEAINSDLTELNKVREDMPLEDLIACIRETKFIPLSRKKQECDITLKEKAKAYRDLGKEVIKGLQEDLTFIEDPILMAHLPHLGELMATLVKLIEEFEARYQEAKQNHGLVDYNDLEHLCLELLVEPVFDEQGELVSVNYTDVAKELSHFYKEVYIDEYQDSNTVQETLLSAVANANEEGPTRFMVGDMKQSIYRFRLANPLIFAEKYGTWEKHQITEEAKEKNVCIDLSKNFRSRENVLQGVNDLFKQVMSVQVGELEYDDYAELKVGNHYQDGNLEELPEGALADTIEVHVLETKEQEGIDETGLEDLKNVECEALMVANLVDKLLKGEGNPTHVFDKTLGTYRRVEARDIVILLRATKEKAGIYENALVQKGIGAYADIDGNFFDALEIQTIISLLKIIDNPLQDIPLLTVLRSPIVGLSLDELVYIRKATESGCFYEALLHYLQSGEESTKLTQFMTLLNEYRMNSSELGLEELLARLYVETGYYRYVAMLPTGAKKKANLELFKKYAEAYENNQNGKLFGFINYLDELAQTPDGLAEAKLVGENENLVQIMSIHKSKGLEFSIVFLCDAGKRFNNNDLMKSVLLHNELGLGPDYLDTKSYVKYPTIPKMAIKNQILSENVSEEMRVLYVALTRAKEKLFITGTLNDIQDAAYKWSLYASREDERILPLGVKRGGSYLNWIGLSLYAHKGIADLRAITNEEVPFLFEGEGKWELRIWNKEELGTLQVQNVQAIEEKRDLLESWDVKQTYGPYKEEIFKRLNYTYPYQESVLLPTKVSVSEIKRATMTSDIENDYYEKMLYPLQEEAPVPSFVKGEEELKGVRRGTLIHSVFEHLDFIKFAEAQSIEEEIKRLVATHQLSQEVLQVINYKRLEEMASSEIVHKMRRAKYIEKEKAFIYLAPARLVDETYPEEEEILIQGVIDSFYIDEEGITLIDYKTDYVDSNQKALSIAQIKQKYAKQLELYGEALSRISQLKVAHKYIYLYNINEWISL